MLRLPPRKTMRSKWCNVRWPISLFALVAICDVAMFSYLRFGFSPGWPSDSLAHELNARMMVDSLTPGFSQLGFWPPLLHVLLLPAAFSDVLYASDSAGFVTLFPVLYVASYLLFRIAETVGGNRRYAWLAVLLFLMNPFVLYFSAAAMTEMVFIAAFFGFLYTWLRWMEGGGDGWVMSSALLVSVMFLSRYEGIVMIPLCLPLFFGSALYKGASIRQALALLLMCAVLSTVGLGCVFIYGLYYGGDPFAFLSIGVRSSSNVSVAKVVSRLIPTQEHALFSWKTGVEAAKYLSGTAFWYVGCFAGACALFAAWNVKRIAVLLLAAVPFVSIVLLIAIHRAGIVVPGLGLGEENGWGPNAFHNTRYLLPAIAFPIIGSVLYIGSMRPGIASRVARLALSVALLATSAWHLLDVTLVNRFWIIRNDVTRVDARWSMDPTSRSLFDRYYDYGFMLVPRYFSEVVMIRSRVPIRAYIHEGTYRHIRQALREPWLFARTVVVNYKGNGSEIEYLRFVADTDTFRSYYTEVYRDPSFAVFKLNEQALRRAAQQLGYDTSSIPSLQTSLTPWNPDTIYRELRETKRLTP